MINIWCPMTSQLPFTGLQGISSKLFINTHELWHWHWKLWPHRHHAPPTRSVSNIHASPSQKASNLVADNYLAIHPPWQAHAVPATAPKLISTSVVPRMTLHHRVSWNGLTQVMTQSWSHNLAIWQYSFSKKATSLTEDRGQPWLMEHWRDKLWIQQ